MQQDDPGEHKLPTDGLGAIGLHLFLLAGFAMSSAEYLKVPIFQVLVQSLWPAALTLMLGVVLYLRGWRGNAIFVLMFGAGFLGSFLIWGLR